MPSSDSHTRLAGLLPEPALRDLARRGIPRQYRRGEQLLRQGDPGFHVLVLLEGWVRVMRSDPRGTEVMLATRSAVDIVGEAAVLDDRPRSASLRAGTDCDVRVVGAADFLDFIAGTGVMHGVLRLVLARLQEADDLSTELASLPVRQRVARVLLRLTGAASTAGPIVLALPQDELARAVGASRNAVGMELSLLREGGIIRTARRRIHIDDLEALRSRAG